MSWLKFKRSRKKRNIGRSTYHLNRFYYQGFNSGSRLVLADCRKGSRAVSDTLRRKKGRTGPALPFIAPALEFRFPMLVIARVRGPAACGCFHNAAQSAGL